jgi:hypothetical protein
MHPDDERYRIPGTNIQNFTAWSRENIRKGPPAYWVGWEVEVLPWDDEDHGVGLPQRGRIERVGPDCDLTPLYSIRFGNGTVVHGLGEDSLRPLDAG